MVVSVETLTGSGRAVDVRAVLTTSDWTGRTAWRVERRRHGRWLPAGPSGEEADPDRAAARVVPSLSG